jgi:hypothetical protein
VSLDADEHARESALDPRREPIDIHAARQKRAGIVGLVDAPRLDLDAGEARRRQLGAVLLLFERAGDAAH